MLSTSEAQSLAALYGRPVLDCVIEVGIAVAADQAARPGRYRNLPDAVARTLTDFRDKTGRDAEWPDKEQRSTHYGALSGKRSPDGHPQTCLAEVTFLDAAESLQGSGSKTHPALLDTARTFQSYLRTLDGEVVGLANQATAAMFARASQVLACDAIAQAFGRRAPKGKESSFAAPEDVEAAGLIEAITQELDPPSTGEIPRFTFLVAQRLAAARSAAVQALLEARFAKNAAALGSLATSAISWARALRDFHADTVIRAWKFVKAAERPGETRQLAMPTNPAGWRLQLDSMFDSLALGAGST